MKKLALAIGFGAYIVFGASGGTIAAHLDDSAASRSAIRDTIVWDTDNTFSSDGSCLSR